MNKQDLDLALNYFIDNKSDVGVVVYAIMKNEEKPKKLDIEGEALPDLKDMFLTSVFDGVVNNEKLTLMNLSSSDERANAIYEYDIDRPAELSALDKISSIGNHEVFNLSKNSIEDVVALLIEIGDNEKQLVLYKTMARVNIYGRTSFFMKKSRERFEKINEEFFRISPNFHLLQVDGSLIVLDLPTVEKFFGFHDVIKNEASLGVEAIANSALVENPETLRELVDDVSFARKLTRIAKSSPVIKAGIPNDKIIDFCKSFPSLKDRIRFNADESKILLDTRKSKDLFIQLLMDNFLMSELTNYKYTSLAKDDASLDAVDA